MLILSCRCSPSLHTYVGHCGLMYSPSHLSGWVQQLFLVESRGNTVLFLCSSWLPCSGLDDSISSTTSLQLRFNCWPNTHFLLFGHDLYTASWVPLYITNKNHILYTSGQYGGDFYAPLREICLVNFWWFWCKNRNERQQLRPFLMTCCSLGFAFTESNDVWQPFTVASTQS